jgi:hypothetical protein
LAVRTTSTLQCARVTTAVDTLPSNNRAKPVKPRAPTKMQSASQLSAREFYLPFVMDDLSFVIVPALAQCCWGVHTDSPPDNDK